MSVSFQPWDYENVAASQSLQVIGPTSGTTKTPGTNFFSHIIVVPETADAGTIAIKDGSETAVNVFVTGTLPSTQPFTIPIRAMNRTGSWQVTTGANVHVIAVGRFT